MIAHGLSLVLRVALVLWLAYGVLVLLPWPRAVSRAAFDIAGRLRLRGLRQISGRAVARQALAAGDIEIAHYLAIETIQAGLRPLNPSLLHDMVFFAAVLSRSGQLDDADTWLAEAEAAAREDHGLKRTILLARAYNLVALERYEEAEAAVRHAAALKNGWDQWLERRRRNSVAGRWELAMAQGYVAYAAERFDDALAFFRVALYLVPRLPIDRRLHTLNNLASAATRAGQLSMAEDWVGAASRLGAGTTWLGRVYFLRTLAELRLAQGRPAEARVAVGQALALGGRRSETLILAAEGATGEALGYSIDIRPPLRDRRSRNRTAAVFERLVRMGFGADLPVTADELCRRSAAPPAGRLSPEPHTASAQVLERVRGIVAGRQFGPIHGEGSVLLGLWVSMLLWLAVSILLPWDPPLVVVLVQCCLLIAVGLAGGPVLRWLLRPRSVALNERAPA